jgi:hypothetical protein
MEEVLEDKEQWRSEAMCPNVTNGRRGNGNVMVHLIGNVNCSLQ